MDRENVIKGLKTCISPDKRCSDGCPYYIFHNNVSEFCFERLIKDTYAMLEEQEAKTPVEYEHNGYWNYTCPTCGNHEELLRQWNYCPFCGQAVKWE